jgi:hypothetical protein
MTRIMYSFTSMNVSYMKSRFPDIAMIAWYGTGSHGIPWTDADRAEWPGANMLEIDQGGAGSPVPTAHIRDVESGAWPPGAAVDRTGWHVARPTIYGSRQAIDQAVADGWRGDVWLAAPGTAPVSAPVIPEVNVVAVQNVWAANYESSIVFDDTWHPVTPVPPVQPGLTVTVTQRWANMDFPAVPDADHYVIHYQATPATAPVVLGHYAPPVRAIMVALDYQAVPGSRGGMIWVDGIVHGAAVRVGLVGLP